MHVVELDGVRKSFPKTGEVIRPFSLSIPSGQFVCFLGPSGCGKSTLLRLIAGLERPDAGTVKVDEGAKGGISYVFQEPHLLPWRTTLLNVCLPLEIGENANAAITSEVRIARARRALESVGLGEALSKMPHELSGGMKMRASLARALVTEPRILLLDEPFGALDEVTRFQLQEDLLKFWRATGITVVFVTHSMSEAAFLGQRQLVFTKRPATVIADHKSRLGNVRDASTRHSAEFTSEVKDLQTLFRSDLSGASATSGTAP